MEFMGRLAALVPRPRVNLTRFHGVFSPNSKLREHVVPQKPVEVQENPKVYSMTHCSFGGTTAQARFRNRSERGPIKKCDKCGDPVTSIDHAPVTVAFGQRLKSMAKSPKFRSSTSV